MHLLEALAQIPNSHATQSLTTLLTNESRNLPWGSTTVVITAVPTEHLVRALLRIKRRGRRVALILVGDSGDRVNCEGMTVYQVPATPAWDELETLELKAKGQ
jgi:hypothetical protein